MRKQRLSYWKKLCLLCASLWLCFPFTLHASIIETTIGTAVVNDATAAYFNPAALVLLKNKQIIALGSVANFKNHFNGQSTLSASGYTLSGSGSANANTNFYLPSLYIGIPTLNDNKLSFGVAIIYNYFARTLPDDSIARYVLSDNRIQDINFVPAIGFKINNNFSLGFGLNVTSVDRRSEPISGFPNIGINDAKSINETSGTSIGGDIGCLIRISQATVLGLNYRSAITYQMEGKSIYEGTPNISADYKFKFWTPARAVFSFNHFLTPKLGLIGTFQYIQWNIMKSTNSHGIATRLLAAPVVIANLNSPVHLRNTWLLTLGAHYHITPQWVIRGIVNYTQSPSNGSYQISNGDEYILAFSTGYKFNKNITIDAGYGHSFINTKNISIANATNITSGTNNSSRNAFSVKLTVNV